MMGVAIVRALNSIKRDGIGGVANNPVEVWPLWYHLGDASLGKVFTFLAENF